VSFLAGNLEALAGRDPGLARRLGEAPVAGNALQIIPSAGGLPTARLGGALLHGAHDPRREAARQVASETDGETSTVVVLGFGLGYPAEQVLADRQGASLLVVEPDAAVFAAALAARDLRGLLSSPRAVFHVGSPPEGLPAALEQLPLEKTVFLPLRPRVEKDPEAFRAAEEIARSFLLRREVNVNTLRRFGRLWVRNLCRNVAAFAEAPGILPLVELFAGIPALVLGGGPTFDEVAPRLPELARRMLVVAVNTSLRPCLAAGVCPDITLVVDPQYWASRSLDWALPPRGLIVAEPSTHPRAVRAAGDRLLLCGSLFPLGEMMEAAVGPRGKLGAGGSVSTSAWDLARLAGCSPVYTAGLDLGYPGMRTHAARAFFEEGWLSAGTRLAPAEGMSRSSLREIGLFPVRSAGGGWVSTDRRMLLYKWWFENAIAMRPGLISRVLSPHGVGIEGMPCAGLEEALCHPPARERIEAALGRASEALAAARASAPGRRQALASALARLQDQLLHLEQAARRGEASTAALGEVLARGLDPGPHIRALDRVDEEILEASSRNVAGFLIQSFIHRVQGGAQEAAGSPAVLAASREMYGGIRESALFQGGLLERAARELLGAPGE
jgi:hypothetical protein